MGAFPESRTALPPQSLTGMDHHPGSADGASALNAFRAAMARPDGLAVLIGDPAFDPSRVLHAVADEAEASGTKVILLSGADRADPVLAVLNSLNCDATSGLIWEQISAIVSRITDLMSKGQSVVLLIDDAQELDPTAFLRLRRLAQMGDGTHRWLPIGLSGHPALAERLGPLAAMLPLHVVRMTEPLVNVPPAVPEATALPATTEPGMVRQAEPIPAQAPLQRTADPVAAMGVAPPPVRFNWVPVLLIVGGGLAVGAGMLAGLSRQSHHSVMPASLPEPNAAIAPAPPAPLTSAAANSAPTRPTIAQEALPPPSSSPAIPAVPDPRLSEGGVAGAVRPVGDGLMLVAVAGDTLPDLYRRVYQGTTPPSYEAVAALNPQAIKPGAVVIFPRPADGWVPKPQQKH